MPFSADSESEDAEPGAARLVVDPDQLQIGMGRGADSDRGVPLGRSESEWLRLLRLTAWRAVAPSES